MSAKKPFREKGERGEGRRRKYVEERARGGEGRWRAASNNDAKKEKGGINNTTAFFSGKVLLF